MTGAAMLLAIVTLATPALAQQAPPRDTVRRSIPTGTGSIAGSVIVDEDRPKALRRARVTATSAELPDGRTVITRDDGGYRFDELPAGRYTLRAAKDGYVAMAYGARRPTGQGATINVRSAEAVRGINIRLPHGAVIGGLIVDADGQPMPGVAVAALAWRFLPAAGERRLVPAGAAPSVTDDRGEYRIFGLPAGEYVIGAAAHGPGTSTGELQVISDAEIGRALSELRQAKPTRSRPGFSPPAPPPSSRPALPRTAVTYAPVYFPGTATVASASLVAVGRGEERLGVDITVEYVPVARVSGFAVFPDAAGANLDVLIIPSERAVAGEGMRMTRASPAGGFGFIGVAPGRYTVFASAYRGQRAGGAPPIAWASAEIVVNGEDVSGVFVTPQPPLTISGRVAFEGATLPPANLSGVRLPLPAVQAIGNAQVEIASAQLDQRGRFSLSVLPGPYRLAATVPGVRAPLGPWFLTSIAMRGREILDAPLEFQQGADDVVVTFSDRATELTGRVVTPAGDAGGDGYAIVFSSNRSTWFPYSRRVAAVRPRDDGTFTIRNLPPGDYFAVATNDVDTGEWHDAALLERLSAGAVRITLGEAEKKVQDLRMR